MLGRMSGSFARACSSGYKALRNLSEDSITENCREDLLARIGEAHTLKAITLSITTRAIRFGLAHLSFIAVSYHEIAVPSVYAQYRVFLAVLEAKLEKLKHDYPIAARDTELAYNYRVNSDLLHVAQTAVVAPEPMKRVINAVGILQYDEGVYIPTVAREATDDRGRFVPCAESILYSYASTWNGRNYYIQPIASHN
ncbi:unnamed protein product [Arctia plantaginis]|uniref:Uncharacterized protein n=1 Tax=Arctia plantaginis TaxID=874455 RepID=A0A8S1A1J2_ARCPL|nr:unnamed protein product [Arctia plantaginis]